MNPQEIRNNVFAGPLNNKINELGESADFHKALGIINKDKSNIYKEMRDSELVLRFMTFSETWETFSGGVRIQMDTFMENNKTLKPRSIKTLEEKFIKALENVVTIFGDEAFKRWQPTKDAWRNQRLASLYDAQMLGLQNYRTPSLANHKDEIVQKFKSLFGDERFLRSVDAATNTPSFLKFRVAHIRETVKVIIENDGKSSRRA